MTSQVRYTATETEQLLRHALDSTTRLTKGRLATELGVAPARISEGLSGEWKLGGDKREKLIKRYGQPRGKRGRYVEAETSESISDFLQCEQEISRKRHLETILVALTAPGFLQELAGHIIKPDREDFSGIPPVLTPRQASQTLEKVEQFLLSPEFTEWLEAIRIGHQRLCREKASAKHLQDYFRASTFYDIDQVAELAFPIGRPEPPSDHGLKDHADKYGLAFQDINGLDLAALGAAFLSLQDEKHYRAAGLKEPISLAKPPRRKAFVENKEFVITGDSVWQEQGRFNSPKIGQPFTEAGVFRIPLKHPHQVLSPTFERQRNLEVPSSVKGVNWNLDYWTTYRVELFLNQDCNYALVIELGTDHGPFIANDLHLAERTILIPKISGRHVIEHLNDLRDWLGMEELPETSIKENIALAGGYIPGAEIL
ncbi:hypothetical protein ACP86_19320 [Marinobacter sp. CP1]|jgi:hypothetical protein|uniref:hypothetical protein n=1 Tax=Marinobacter sp. CP1 TaxID=1671721 RepID=UPI00069F6F91|nr:hypothetical protein [Marinobacter sp. CP1]AKV98116.1 hypothetical protein ACP86_19320 [Marinobacter sp. CP1]